MLLLFRPLLLLLLLPLCVVSTIVRNNNQADLLKYKSECHANITDYPRDQGPPRKWGILLFRGFEPLDVFGPQEVLHSLGLTTTHIELSLIAQTLEAVTTRLVMPIATNSSAWISINPTHTFQTAPTDLEVLVVPGGAGTRAPLDQFNQTFAYIQKTYPKLRYLITVCTGSLLVARGTAILNGRNATTNKLAFRDVAAANTAVNWFPSARWVVDGNIWTGSGVSSGIDTTFAAVECWFGAGIARNVSKFTEYTRHEDPRDDPFAVDFDLVNSTSGRSGSIV